MAHVKHIGGVGSKRSESSAVYKNGVPASAIKENSYCIDHYCKFYK